MLELSDRLISIAEVSKLVGLSEGYIRKKVRQRQFPIPIRFGSRAVRWKITEVQNWVEKHASIDVP